MSADGRAQELAPAVWAALEAEARSVQQRAYAPYSRFRVGAAVLGDDGVIYGGCNVENASYGATVCAERVAVGRAIASGARSIVACVVVGPLDEAITPCGMCRQVLSEFGPRMPIRCVSMGSSVLDTTMEALLPGAFAPEHLQRPRGTVDPD